MKPFKNKLAVTIVLLSVAFCGMIIYSLQSDANGISSSVSTVVSPLQKMVYNINSRVKETVDFFLNFSEVKLENEQLKQKNAELANELIEYESLEIKGRDMITGLPKVVTITEEQVREALKEPVYAIIESIKTTLEKTPPELAADIIEKGIMLAGGGALLNGLDRLLESELNVPVFVADDALNCVANGCGVMLENLHYMK